MGFLLSHWHCLLPVAAIAAAALFMRDRSGREEKREARPEKSEPAGADEKSGVDY
jgi:hypothetical protein